MPFFVDATPIQDWLEDTKLTVPFPLEEGLESLHVQRVLGVLAIRYNVSTWLTATTTPVLVSKLVAMLYAATLYRRQYSEDLGNNPAWPVWLEKTAMETLALIVSGAIDLIDVIVEVDTGLLSPIFYPNDAADVDDPRSFAMATKF